MKVVVVVCDRAARGGNAVLDGVPLRRVAVVRWGEHHGRLVRLRVLMVEVDHTSAAERDSSLTAGREEDTQMF